MWGSVRAVPRLPRALPAMFAAAPATAVQRPLWLALITALRVAVVLLVPPTPPAVGVAPAAPVERELWGQQSIQAPRALRVALELRGLLPAAHILMAKAAAAVEPVAAVVEPAD